ncbi:uncharacterized protein V1510DRAFT_415428 [Dipodascopsis tothii]|uniref:uncharacterized protein n=1 Tax=Dipodascopsis tothii TaxID=44089 RepID=UPI0034CF305B
MRHVLLRRVAGVRVASGVRRFADQSFMAPRPSPLRLPKEDQEEFERLQQEANENVGAFSVQDVDVNASPSAQKSAADMLAQIKRANGVTETPADAGMHPDYRGRTIAEFEGDRNPVTGEIGGPKQDPLKHGDYSFNGRVTDF